MSRPLSCPDPQSARRLSAASLTAAHLRTLAQNLVAAPLSGTHLVHVRSDDGGIQVSVLALDELQPEAEHPLDALIGFRAPPAWQALGIVANGTAHPLAGHRGDAGGRAPSTPVRVALLIARNGTQASALTSQRHRACDPSCDRACDRSPEWPLPTLGHEPVEGLLGDALRRCLALSTPPAMWPPSRWLTSRWLDQLTLQAPDAAGASGAHRPHTRADALASHPLATPRPDGASQLDASPIDCALEALDEAGWEGLRHAAAAEPAAAHPLDTAAHMVSPALARWADAGSLARLLQAELPPASFLLDAARALLAPPVAATVLSVANRWLP